MENLTTTTESYEKEFALREVKDEEEALKKKIPHINKKEQMNNIPNRPPTTFWWIKLSQTEIYSVPWITQKTSREWTNAIYKNALVLEKNGKTYRASHKETHYTDRDRRFPTKNIERRIRSILNKDRKMRNLPRIPNKEKVIQYAKDWTIRDINWYIVLAANLWTYPRGTIIMTTLWPGRVYDTWKLSPNHIDIYTHR